MKIFRHLIADERYNPNVQINPSKDTLLHIAVKYGKDDTIVRLLSHKKCDPNAQNKEGDTPSHFAVKQSRTAAISQLLAHQQCNPNVQNKEGDTPLHIACCMKLLDIIKHLLQKKCITNIPNKKGETAQDIPLNDHGDRLLHIACQWGDVNIVEYLIRDERCDPNVQTFSSENTPLHIAVKYGQDDIIVQLLSYLECNPNVQNKEGDTPLHLAVKQSRTAAISQLLPHQQCNPNVQNKEGDTPLHIACCRKLLDIIKHLLQKKCITNIPNKKGETAQDIPLTEDGDRLLHIACQWGDVNIVEYLISDEQCNPNVQTFTSENTPLHIAVKYWQDDIIVQLLSYMECNPNAQNKNGYTPLHIAVKQSRTAAISQLFAHQQCNPNVQNNEGDTPLHIACCMKLVDIIKHLLQKKCITNIPNKKGKTAQDIPLTEHGDHLLHIACQCSDVDTVRYLIIDEKCNPNIQSCTSENTPLHIAVKFVQDDALAQLLSCKECNPNLPNRWRDTPLHTAARLNGTAAISQLLAHQQCNINAQNKVGDTPLHIAIKVASKFTVSYLLSNQQCNPNIQNIDSETPMHIAARKVQEETIIEHLLSHEKCDLNVRNKDGDTPLLIACYLKSFTFVKHLLGKKCIHDGRCDLNVQNANLNTPLHVACYRKSFDIVKCFIEMRCSTNILNKKGETAQNISLNKDGDCLLHIACQWNDVDILRYLVNDETCTPNIPNCCGDTPLHIACYWKSLNIVRYFLEKRCSTNIPNKKGETAQDIPLNEDGDCLLHIACQLGDVGIVRYLITDERCNPNVQSSLSANTPLHIAVKYEQVDIIFKLVSYKECNPNAQNKNGDTPLHIAVRQSVTAAISQLLALQQCDSNIQNNGGDTPLHIACYMKLPIITKLLLEMRCSTNISNTKGETAQDIPLNEDGDHLLHIACQWGDVNIVEYLINDEKCNSNVQSFTSKNTPLHIAVKYRQVDTIVQLLSYLECNPNLQNKEGDTPLHLAVKQSRTAAISQLFAHQQCNPNVQNREGDTPLHIACCMKLLDIIKHLLQKKCITNIPNKKGETAQDIPLTEDGDRLLHIACQWGDVNIVEYLINDEGCDPNVQNISKNTPLHFTVMYGQVHYTTTIQLLSCKECNLNIQNEKGHTPLHIACYWKSLNIVRHFLERRCSTNIPNKKGEAAQDIPLNEDGDCLLHIACQWGDVGIVRYLITDEGCDTNSQSSLSENSPLHIAVKHKQDDAIVQLLSYKVCNLNVQNEHGDTALHFAVRQRNQLLLANEQCNSKVQNKECDTPQHIACCSKSLHIVRLLLERKCSTNIPNKNGETAQNVPLTEDGDLLLHIACQWDDVDIVRHLINDDNCDISITNSNLNTPLHIACYMGSINIARLLLEMRSSTNIPNKKGEMAQNISLNKNGDYLLHIACKWDDVSIVRYLITDEDCDPNVQNLIHNTPLHIVCEHGQNGTPNISHLLANKQCNPNVLNNDHLTPLLVAIKHNNSSAATALLHCNKCDPTLCDPHGNTPLHLACIAGETQPEMVEVAKQLLTSVNPLCVNNAGQTPIELTTNYQLIQAISYFVKCKTKQAVQTYINLFIVGNPETGKSTLVKAICKEATNILWRIVPKQVRRVKNVPLHTAGIIPTTFRSKTFGNAVLYDLAGQLEYYSSHAAVIQSTVISTPPVFVVVINLSQTEEIISQRLRYWWSFIDNHAAQSSEPPQVILVGSHADIVKSAGGSVQEKMTQMSNILKRCPTLFKCAGQVAIDCRDPASKQLKLFCSIVNQSCTVLRQTADVDLHCHVLYAFLLEKFKGEVACTVSDVATSVKENSELLPQTPDSLIPLISILSDKGLLLLVKGGESHGNWWVILQKQALMGKMNGVIFAPKSFTQHKDLSWSTGVVLFSKLKIEFPDYNPNMISEFLVHLEFCFKIEDHKTLALLKDETANEEDTYPDVSEVYYFFPALVSVKNPLRVWELNDVMFCKCGWISQCIQHDQFLTTQFLHVLILRLAFTFALKLDPGDCREDSLALRRKCSVWKHGIAWLNRVPIETVVEVGLQYQSVIVIMRCPKGKEAECVQLRSEVIQKVLQAKDEHCKAVKMSESFLHPTDVSYPFTDNIEAAKCYSLTEIARVKVKAVAIALDHSGKNPIPVQELLLFDPCNADTSPELLVELFSEKHSMDETMRSQVLEVLNSEYR